MKTASFGAHCPYCRVGTMVASVLHNDRGEFHLFEINSRGEMYFNGICSNCEAEFTMTYLIMKILFDCPEEEDETVPSKQEVLSVSKVIMIL
jgi:hypothetical protein